MGQQYERYKKYQAKAQALKETRRKITLLSQSGDSPNPLYYLINEMERPIKSIIENMESEAYGWSGTDARACLSKLRELKSEFADTRLLFGDLCQSIYDGIEAERVRYANLALNATYQFDAGEMAQWYIDTGFSSVQAWWKSML